MAVLCTMLASPPSRGGPDVGRGAVAEGVRNQSVLVMRHAVRRGEAVDCATVVESVRGMAPSAALLAPCQLPESTVALRPLGAGDVLRASDVGSAPAVSLQGSVRLRVTVGQVRVERAGTALADARIGEQVLVRLNGSQQAVRGVVVDRNVVELPPEETL